MNLSNDERVSLVSKLDAPSTLASFLVPFDFLEESTVSVEFTAAARVCIPAGNARQKRFSRPRVFLRTALWLAEADNALVVWVPATITQFARCWWKALGMPKTHCNVLELVSARHLRLCMYALPSRRNELAFVAGAPQWHILRALVTGSDDADVSAAALSDLARHKQRTVPLVGRPRVHVATKPHHVDAPQRQLPATRHGVPSEIQGLFEHHTQQLTAAMAKAAEQQLDRTKQIGEMVSSMNSAALAADNDDGPCAPPPGAPVLCPSYPSALCTTPPPQIACWKVVTLHLLQRATASSAQTGSSCTRQRRSAQCHLLCRCLTARPARPARPTLHMTDGGGGWWL